MPVIIMHPYLANRETAEDLGIDRPKLANVKRLGHSYYW